MDFFEAINIDDWKRKCLLWSQRNYDYCQSVLHNLYLQKSWITTERVCKVISLAYKVKQLFLSKLKMQVICINEFSNAQ